MEAHLYDIQPSQIILAIVQPVSELTLMWTNRQVSLNDQFEVFGWSQSRIESESSNLMMEQILYWTLPFILFWIELNRSVGVKGLKYNF